MTWGIRLEFLDGGLREICLIGMCLPLLWIGLAWGLESVRKPKAKWQQKVRWTWIVPIAVSVGFIVVPMLAAVAFAVEPNFSLQGTLRRLTAWTAVSVLNIGLVAVLPAILLAYLTAYIARRSGRWCLQCGYDLRNNPGTACSECGAARTDALQRTDPRLQQAARTRAYKLVGRYVALAAGIGVIAFVAYVGYDCMYATRVGLGLRCCPACGAVEEEQVSPVFRFPVGGERLVSYAGSAACAHRWVTPREFETEVRRLAYVRDAGAVIYTVGTPPSLYAALEMPAATGDPYVLRWRVDEGPLEGEGVKQARVQLAPCAVNRWKHGALIAPEPTLLLGCEPAELERDAARTLRMSVLRRGFMPDGQVPYLYIRGIATIPHEWEVCAGGGTQSSSSISVSRPLLTGYTDGTVDDSLQVHVLTPEEWKSALTSPSLWEKFPVAAPGVTAFGVRTSPPVAQKFTQRWYLSYDR